MVGGGGYPPYTLSGPTTKIKHSLSFQRNKVRGYFLHLQMPQRFDKRISNKNDKTFKEATFRSKEKITNEVGRIANNVASNAKDATSGHSSKVLTLFQMRLEDPATLRNLHCLAGLCIDIVLDIFIVMFFFVYLLGSGTMDNM